MEIRTDFLEWLGPDASSNVLMLLDDPTDIVRSSAVSRSWRRYVISNGFCKKLCLRRCAGVSCFTHVIVDTTANTTIEEASSSSDTCFTHVIVDTTANTTIEEASSSSDTEWAILLKEHMVYSYLSRCLLKPFESDDQLISEAIRASSTDNNFMQIESSDIESTTRSGNQSYWSSKGERDPEVPETLIYRLGSRLCFVNEIKVQPFEAYSQPGCPIYSAKAVRFRMGHSLLDPEEDLPYTSASSKKLGTNTLYGSDREFVWTYVSPEFPMAQKNELQTFKLPRPALCIGGFLQVELLGRVQVHATDNLYYICICNVQVIGQPPSTFEVDIDLESSTSVLKYFPEDQLTYESNAGLNAHFFYERVRNIYFMKLNNEGM